MVQGPLKRLKKFGSNFDGLDIGWDEMVISFIQYLFQGLK
jgi:hypothetical protein